MVANTGAICGSHMDVIFLATDQVFQRAVEAGSAARDSLFIVGGCHHIAHCVCSGRPEHLSSSGATGQLAGHVSRRTWLWKENPIKRQSL